MSEESKSKNPLARKYTFWYTGVTEFKEGEDYQEQVKPLATIESVRTFHLLGRRFLGNLSTFTLTRQTLAKDFLSLVLRWHQTALGGRSL